MYKGMSLWIPTSKIGYLNVKIVTPYFDREMNPRMGSPEFDSRANQILFFSIAPKLFLWRTQHPAYCIPGFFPFV